MDVNHGTIIVAAARLMLDNISQMDDRIGKKLDEQAIDACYKYLKGIANEHKLDSFMIANIVFCIEGSSLIDDLVKIPSTALFTMVVTKEINHMIELEDEIVKGYQGVDLRSKSKGAPSA